MKLFYGKFKYLILFTLSLYIYSHANETPITYKIGVLALTEKKQTLKKWEATAEYLSHNVKNATFTIIPMTYDEINYAIKNTTIDYLLTNPAHYIIHEKSVHLFRLATVIYSQKNKDISSFGGVIVTLKENNKINAIEDLRDKKIAAVKKGSLGGYQAQLKELLDNKQPLPNPADVTFTDMPHKKTLDLLLSKKVDVAFLRSSVLEKLTKREEINITQFKVINKKHPHYPFAVSTTLYPEWPFAALSHITKETKKEVAEALFNIKSTDSAAQIGNYKGWYIPLDYNVVTELLRELRLPPFDNITNFTIKDIFNKYTEAAIIFFIFGGLVTLYLFIVNLRLYKTEKTLQKNASILQKMNKNLNRLVEEKVAEVREKDQQILEQAKMASLGEMIGNIAHQWRQPLSIISTSSSGIQVQKSLNALSDEKMDEMLEQINSQAQFLSQTIDTFQDFIKEDKKLCNVVLQDRIDAALNIVKATLNHHHIKLINNIDYNDPVYIKLVIGELSQVVMNIINNAKDILLQNKIQDPWVTIDVEQKDTVVLITIEDNAGGIPQDIQGKVFEPYFTTKHKSQGTGLGLHISYRIITESLNGRIWTKNSEHGAKFFIELPLNIAV